MQGLKRSKVVRGFEKSLKPSMNPALWLKPVVCGILGGFLARVFGADFVPPPLEKSIPTCLMCI